MRETCEDKTRNILVVGQPEGKPRVVDAGQGKTKRGKTYTRKFMPTTDYAKALNFTFSQIEKREAKAYIIDIDFYFQRPKSHFNQGLKTFNTLTKKANAESILHNGKILMTNKPDFDNATKAVLDCLVQCQVIHEDANVVGGQQMKYWLDDRNETGRTEIKIRYID